ncbi:hypothetical protein C900_00527 [Fulvivirga imtechensis AK7]|uniref:Uncharacterized protein n=1 Tax=Fulvivirga imtechensis AK7 TaxID=1237149 RepID=L8JLG5_9BACT|nr:hypothetical protein C900_00527 [Fulvivirga imtechensis AK7]
MVMMVYCHYPQNQLKVVGYLGMTLTFETCTDCSKSTGFLMGKV